MQRPHDIELQDFKYTGPATGSPREGIRRLTVSPTENKMILEQDEHAHKITNLYSCCCFAKPTDRRLLTFLAQFGMSVLVIVFAIYKLSTENNCACDPINNSNVFYSSILMGTIGIWLPSPRPLS